MPVDYFQYVFLPLIRKYAEIKCTLIKRGYYPKGGGEIELSIKPKYDPSDAPSLELMDFTHIVHIKGIPS